MLGKQTGRTQNQSLRYSIELDECQGRRELIGCRKEDATPLKIPAPVAEDRPITQFL